MTYAFNCRSRVASPQIISRPKLVGSVLMIPVGHHVMTSGLARWAGDTDERHAWIADCLGRHHLHDWGDLERDDWQQNDRAVSMLAGRVLSAYTAPVAFEPVDAQLWIITDDIHDEDTLTTMLWPSEY